MRTKPLICFNTSDACVDSITCQCKNQTILFMSNLHMKNKLFKYLKICLCDRKLHYKFMISFKLPSKKACVQFSFDIDSP